MFSKASAILSTGGGGLPPGGLHPGDGRSASRGVCIWGVSIEVKVAEFPKLVLIHGIPLSLLI